MLTTIPFSGFYGTIHDSEIDRALDDMVSDSNGTHPVSERISESLMGHVSYGKVFKRYAREFVEDFSLVFNRETELGIKIEFESLSSPREYNFTTDRIFAIVSQRSAKKMLKLVDKKVLTEVAKRLFTSRSGFISGYDSDWKSWGGVETWDHNQIGTLVVALVRQFLDEEWEYNVIEDWSSNGIIDGWVYDAMDDEGKRLVNIASYLRQREERKYR